MIKMGFDCKTCTRWHEETQCCPPIKAGYRVFEVKDDCLKCKFYQNQSVLELGGKHEEGNIRINCKGCHL